MDEMQKREKKWRLTQNLGFLFPTIMGLALLILVITFVIPNRPAAPEKVTTIATGSAASFQPI